MWLLSSKFALLYNQYSPSEINKDFTFYSNITTDNEWEDSSEQSDPVLQKLLTDKNASESNSSDQTDSDDDIESNGKFKQRELKESYSPFPTVMYSVDGPSIALSEIVDIAPGEGQIPVLFHRKQPL